MVDSQAEALAIEVLDAFEIDALPVDPLTIAERERIVLAPSSNFGPEFHGRLEFVEETQKFMLAFPVPDSGRITARGRFSVAHELGHYYSDVDRSLILEGAGAHDSFSGFICDDETERRADAFAAALLMPKNLVEGFFSWSGPLELAALKNAADEFGTSIQCAAIRYSEISSRPCSIVISRVRRNGWEILLQTNSDKASEAGAKDLIHIPIDALANDCGRSSAGPIARDTWSTEWFGDRVKRFRLREEAISLDLPGYSMTMLSWD